VAFLCVHARKAALCLALSESASSKSGMGCYCGGIASIILHLLRFGAVTVFIVPLRLYNRLASGDGEED
jgi:hypothetical protein